MTTLKPQLNLEYEWLQKGSITEVHDKINITWSSHHADKKRDPEFNAFKSNMLLLLRDQAHSVATIRHVKED